MFITKIRNIWTTNQTKNEIIEQNSLYDITFVEHLLKLFSLNFHQQNIVPIHSTIHEN